MRSDWFVPILESWPSSASLDRQQSVRALRLVKAVSVAAGGRVATSSGAPAGPAASRFAVLRATVALDRYARLSQGADNFTLVAGQDTPPEKLAWHLGNAVAFTRASSGEPHGSPGDALIEDLQAWEADRKAWNSLRRSGAPARHVGVVSGERYAPAVAALIQQARSEIVVAVGLVTWDGTPTHPVTPLAEALIAAARRKLSVVVFDPRTPSRSHSPKMTEAALERLRDGGAQIKPPAGGGMMHTKVVVIDREISVVGSHNWTGPSLTGAVELSLLCESPELAVALLAGLAYPPPAGNSDRG